MAATEHSPAAEQRGVLPAARRRNTSGGTSAIYCCSG